MIDTDLYVLPTVAHYLLDIPQGHNRANEFLSRTATLNNSNVNVSYHDLLARNAAYILGRAVPFAQKPQASNLLHLRPGQPVGNWRDSNQGLGYGQIPFDVNSALVPAALRALQRLTQSGILTLQNQSDAGVQAGRYADVWETHAAPLFDVKVNGATAESRWKDYIVQSNLSDALLGGGNGGKQSDVTFYALSLQDDGTPVDVSGPSFFTCECEGKFSLNQVMNNDLGFGLLFASNISETYLQRVVELLQPYPKGAHTHLRKCFSSKLIIKVFLPTLGWSSLIPPCRATAHKLTF